MNDKTTQTETLTEGNASMDDIAAGLLQTGSASNSKPTAAANSGSSQQVDNDDEDLLPGNDTDTGDDVWNSDDTEQSNDGTADEGNEDGGETEGHEGNENEPFYTVQINGKSERVPLSEALKGYQRGRDYTQKTQELAQLRQTIEAEHTAAKTVRSQYDQQLQTLQTALGDEKNDPTAEDWERLKAESPETYAAEWADYQRRLGAREQVKQERTRVAQEQQGEVQKVIQAVTVAERERLLEHFPQWKDTEKYKVGAKAISDFLTKEYGFTAKEANTTVDHRIIRMAEDARRYRALVVKRDVAKQKLDEAPTVQPRARTPTPARKVVQQQEARTRLVKSGSIDDAAAFIMMGSGKRR